MGYIVFWLESLVTALLLAALVIACGARLQNVWRRRVWTFMALLPIVLFFGGLLLVTGGLEFKKRLYLGLFWPLTAVTVGFLLGTIVIWLRGMRIEPAGNTVAANWPRAKLALAALAALVLHMMTFANLDASARDSLASLHSDAAAMAASAAPQRIPDYKNAALVYQRVFESFQDENGWPAVWRDGVAEMSSEPSDPHAAQDLVFEPEPPFDFGSAALGEFLTAHAGELQLLRSAGAMPDCYFEKNYGRLSFDILLPEIQHLRTGARLLALDARYRAAKGDYRSALDDVQAIYGLAAHAATEPFVVSALVAAAIDAMAGETLHAVLGNRVANADELSVVSLDGTVSYRRLTARAMRMEEAIITTYFADMANIDHAQVANILDIDPAAMPLVAPIYRVFMQGYDLAQYRRFVHRHEQFFAQPYRDAKKRWADERAELDRQQRGLLTALVMPAFGSFTEAAYRTDAKRRVAETALALHRFRAAQGKDAERLDDLVLVLPRFMTIVPLDPYDERPLKYVKTPTGWIVYSIGRDLVDDGGKRYDENKSTGDLRYEFVAPADTQPAAQK